MFDEHQSRNVRDIVSNARPNSLGPEGIPWQIPAVGHRYLSTREADVLSGWIREQVDQGNDDILRFIFIGVDPEEMADKLDEQRDVIVG